MPRKSPSPPAVPHSAAEVAALYKPGDIAGSLPGGDGAFNQNAFDAGLAEAEANGEELQHPPTTPASAKPRRVRRSPGERMADKTAALERKNARIIKETRKEIDRIDERLTIIALASTALNREAEELRKLRAGHAIILEAVGARAPIEA